MSTLGTTEVDIREEVDVINFDPAFYEKQRSRYASRGSPLFQKFYSPYYCRGRIAPLAAAIFYFLSHTFRARMPASRAHKKKARLPLPGFSQSGDHSAGWGKEGAGLGALLFNASVGKLFAPLIKVLP